MPQYLLILRDPGVRDIPPDDLRAMMMRYGTWTDRLRETGRVVGANKLRDGEGRVVRRGDAGDIIVMDGPFVETKEILGGYYLVSADSYEQAIELTRDSPHYDYGSIEVREVEEIQRRG